MLRSLTAKQFFGIQRTLLSTPSISNARYLSFFNNNESDTVREIRRVNSTAIFVIVPQGERWLVERLGKYHNTLEPGFVNNYLPIFSVFLRLQRISFHDSNYRHGCL